MSFKKLIIWGAMLALIAAALATAPFTTRAQSGNLLQNPGFNLPYDSKGYPNSWGHYRTTIPKPDDASALQYSNSADFSSETNPSGKFPQLILEGDASLHVGLQQDPWIAGTKQTVSVPAGSQVRFCAYSRLYANNTPYGKAPSVTSLNGRSQVGIALNGDTNQDNPNIVWSGAANPHDTWENICVTAGPVADAGQVTVFTRNDWRGSAAVHLDSWWDQAELVVLGAQPTTQATAQAQQPQATTAPVQPQATAQPLPGGGVVHTVVAGDTLFALSLQYNVPIDQIYALNELNAQSILSIGQQIIIKPGAGTSVPSAAQPTAAPAQPTAVAQSTAAPGAATPTSTTPQPAGTTPESPSAGPTAAATQTSAGSSNTSTLCLFAFEDTNADGLRQPDEGPVAGATFKVVDGQGAAVAEYVSTTDPKPHCIDQLMPGSYNITVVPASGATATSDKRWGVPLTGGSTVTINFGSRGGEGSSPTSDNSGSPASTGGTSSANSGKSSGGSNVGGIIAGIGGLVLLLAAGVIGAFVIARRRG